MSKPELSIRPDLEPKRNTLLVDPSELMRNNPAALVVNQETYKNFEVNFDPGRFQQPEVVWVQSYTNDGKPYKFLAVVDGLTRTAYYHNHKGAKHTKYPNIDFGTIPVNNVTQSEINNPLTVPPEEKTEDQDYLTMGQYLRAVVPATKVHADIAPLRMAVHIINGGKHIIGQQLSERFSTLAILSILSNPQTPRFTNDELLKYLKRQPQIIAGETPEERKQIEKAFLEINSIIKYSELSPKSLADNAFSLVGSGSEIVGGPRQTRDQVMGLLYLPSVDQKLSKQVKEIGSREELRFALGDFIVDKITQTPAAEKQKYVSTIIDALRDPDISYSHFIDIANSTNPARRYNEVRADVNFGILSSLYTTTVDREITDTESRIIEQVGRTSHLDHREINSTVRFIKQASEAVEVVDGFLNDLLEKAEELKQQGVKDEFITEITSQLTDLRNRVIDANTTLALNMARNKLINASSGYEDRLHRIVDTHDVKLIADEVFTEHKEGYGQTVKEGIVRFAIDTVGTRNKTAIRNLFEQLHNLPTDLQARVVSRDIPLQRAIRLHEEAQARAAYDREQTSKPKVVEQKQTVEPKPVAQQPIQKPEQVQQPLPNEEATVKAHELAKTKVNESIIADVHTFIERLSRYKISPEDLSPEARKEIETALNTLGQLGFNHPDIVRVFKDYLRQMRVEQQETQSKIVQEQGELYDSSRTGIF